MPNKRSESNCLPHRKIVLKPGFISRFWNMVVKHETDCWRWSGYKNKQGYGRIGMSGGKCINAHRVSWVIHNGEIPDGLFVCHKCDNPSCVRPEHLFLGTRQDNMNEMMIKKRGKHFNSHSFYGIRFEERYDRANRRGRWRSFICKNEKMIYIGTHTSALEAARNYDRIAYIVFGERERLNFPKEYDINIWK